MGESGSKASLGGDGVRYRGGMGCRSSRKDVGMVVCCVVGNALSAAGRRSALVGAPAHRKPVALWCNDGGIDSDLMGNESKSAMQKERVVAEWSRWVFWEGVEL